MPLIDATETTLPATLAANRLVAVDFWAPWCGPCKTLTPVLEKLAAELSGHVVLAKVNVDDEAGLAAKYGIRSVPTVLLFLDGQLADQWSGLANETTWRARLAERAAA